MTGQDKPGSAQILRFPGRPAAETPLATTVQPGDMVVMCLNASVGLWCAWPVAAVDADGVVMGVQACDGRTLCAGRLSCDPTVYGLSAAQHQAEGFAALRWKTWRDPLEALRAFAAIGRSAPEHRQET